MNSNFDDEEETNCPVLGTAHKAMRTRNVDANFEAHPGPTLYLDLYFEARDDGDRGEGRRQSQGGIYPGRRRQDLERQADLRR